MPARRRAGRQPAAGGARGRPARCPVLLRVTRLASPVGVEFAEHGRAEALEGQAARLGQQPDRVEAVVGQAKQAPESSVLGMQAGGERVFSVAEQPEQQVLGAELLAAGDGLVAGEPQGSPAHQRGAGQWGVRDGMRGSQPYPLGRVVVGLPAEGLLQAALHRIEVDAEGGQQLGVAGLGAREHALGDQPVDLGPDGLKVQALGAQQAGGGVVAVADGVVAVAEQAEQQVLGPEVVVLPALGLLPAQVGHDAGLLGGVHHAGYLPGPARARGPCFWCTACLLTPSRLAMSCQDQPLARALPTCSASSTSSRPRRAATARRPSSGSWLLVAAASVATWRSAARAGTPPGCPRPPGPPVSLDPARARTRGRRCAAPRPAGAGAAPHHDLPRTPRWSASGSGGCWPGRTRRRITTPTPTPTETSTAPCPTPRLSPRRGTPGGPRSRSRTGSWPRHPTSTSSGTIPGKGRCRCARCWCTWWRSTPGTTATPTCCASGSTGGWASSCRGRVQGWRAPPDGGHAGGKRDEQPDGTGDLQHADDMTQPLPGPDVGKERDHALGAAELHEAPARERDREQDAQRGEGALVRWPSMSTGMVWLTEQRERRCQPGKRSWPPH